MVLYRVDTDFEFARTKPANTNFFVIPEYFPTRPAYHSLPARQVSLTGSRGRSSQTREDEKGVSPSTSHSPARLPPPPVVPAPKRSTPPFTAVNSSSSRSGEQPTKGIRLSHSPVHSGRHTSHNVKKSYRTAQAAGFTVLESMSDDPWGHRYPANDKRKIENYHRRFGRSHSNSPANSIESSHNSTTGSPKLNATTFQAHISDRPKGLERRSSLPSTIPYPRFGSRQVQPLNINRNRSPYYSPLFPPGSSRPSAWSNQPSNFDIGPPTIPLASLVSSEMSPPIRGLSEKLGSHQTTPLNRLGLGTSCVPTGHRSHTEPVERIRAQSYTQPRGESIDSNLPPILALVSQESPQSYSLRGLSQRPIVDSSETLHLLGQQTSIIPPFSLLDNGEQNLDILVPAEKERELKIDIPATTSVRAEESTGAFLSPESLNGAQMSFALPGNEDEESLIGSFVQTCHRFEQLDLFKSQGRENWTLGELEKVVLELESRLC